MAVVMAVVMSVAMVAAMSVGNVNLLGFAILYTK